VKTTEVESSGGRLRAFLASAQTFSQSEQGIKAREALRQEPAKGFLLRDTGGTQDRRPKEEPRGCVGLDFKI
jgi:hypothetical protein